MNEKNHSKSKKKKRIVIFLTIIILITLSFIVYIIYDKITYEKKENKNPIKKEIKEQEEDLNEIAQTLLDKLTKYSLDQLDLYEQNTVYNKILTVAQLETMYYYFLKNEIISEEDSKINKEEIDAYLKEVYEIELSTYPNIICTLDNKISYRYDPEKEAYIKMENHFGHDAVVIQSIYQKIYSIEKDKDEYILVLNKLYQGDDYEGTYGLYSDGTKKNKLDDFDKFINKNGEINIISAIKHYETNYNQYKDITKYKYTFKKKDDFYLTKYAVIR